MPGESQQLPDSAPDPSVLTTEALTRAIRAEREWAEAQLDVLKERLRGIDRATELLSETVTRTPTEIEKEVKHLRELLTEKFASVELQFTERDTRSERESRDNRVAVDAAFAASKEAASEQNKSNSLAISKSESAMSETVTKLAELLRATTDALGDKLDDVKERVGRIESARLGGQESRTEHRNENAALIATITVVVTVLVAAVTIALSLR